MFASIRKSVTTSVAQFAHDESGLTTVEYAVAGAMVAAAVVAAFENLGTAVMGVINGITGDLGGTPAG